MVCVASCARDRQTPSCTRVSKTGRTARGRWPTGCRAALNGRGSGGWSAAGRGRPRGLPVDYLAGQFRGVPVEERAYLARVGHPGRALWTGEGCWWMRVFSHLRLISRRHTISTNVPGHGSRGWDIAGRAFLGLGRGVCVHANGSARAGDNTRRCARQCATSGAAAADARGPRRVCVGFLWGIASPEIPQAWGHRLTRSDMSG